MTLFNVRLGAWLPNPALWRAGGAPRPASKVRVIGWLLDRTLRRKRTPKAPRPHSVMPLIHELTSQSTDTSAEVYVSDGGHFENLGLYEMIRRRCELILVVDGGCDPDARFADLGNAARKIAIDLDTRLEFEEIRIRSRKAAAGGGVAFATAEILYPADDPDEPEDKFVGRLIYLKPALLGHMPVDVMAYSKAYEAFPHEPTTDQWYAESQFESYRQLGQFIASRVDGAAAAPYDGNVGAERLAAFFDEIDAATARSREAAASSPFRMMAEKTDGAVRG
jgi:hypothetical protein